MRWAVAARSRPPTGTPAICIPCGKLARNRLKRTNWRVNRIMAPRISSNDSQRRLEKDLRLLITSEKYIITYVPEFRRDITVSKSVILHNCSDTQVIILLSPQI